MVTTKIYGASVSFYRKLAIYSQILNHYGFWVKILKKIKTHKNSYIGPLCITNLEYEVTTKNYGVLVCFWNKLVIFDKTVG
jgi:hypothetical protein